MKQTENIDCRLCDGVHCLAKYSNKHHRGVNIRMKNLIEARQQLEMAIAFFQLNISLVSQRTFGGDIL